MAEKYLEVIVARKEPYCAGQVKHEGTTYYAPGYIKDEQVKSILGDRSGMISARFVEEVPQGAKVMGAPAVQRLNAKDTVAKIGELTDAGEIRKLVEGDERKSVQDAAAARIAALEKPAE